MMDTILQYDRSLLIFLNGLRSSFGDYFFWYATKEVTWIPLFLLFLFLLWKQFGTKIWIPLLFILLTLLLTDQLSRLLKETIERLRPTHDSTTKALIQTVRGYRGGSYSFPSGHATNTFGIAVFLYKIYGKLKRPRWLTITLFSWCSIMSYSRIYLGVHYPSDIIVGAILGSSIALLTSRICLQIVSNHKFIAIKR